jgi:hypothetical protein
MNFDNIYRDMIFVDTVLFWDPPVARDFMMKGIKLRAISLKTQSLQPYDANEVS